MTRESLDRTRLAEPESRTGVIDAGRARKVLERILISRRLGRYRLEQQLGAGAMGVVYRAHDEELDRQVVLKIILPHVGESAVVFERFAREAKILGRLAHASILRVHDFGLAEDVLPFHVCEHIEGTDLARLLAKGNGLDESRVRRWAIDLVGGLEACHAQGVIHRDVKPSNVLVTGAEDRALLIDFGIARDERAAAHLTRTGMLLGTPAYMPPELVEARHDDVGPWTDIYSLGATLYHALSGRSPFEGDTAMAVLGRVLAAAPESLSTLAPGIDPGFAAAVHRALEKDPRARYATAREMARALRGQATEDRRQTTGAETRRSGEPRRGQKRASQARGVLWVIAATILVVAGGLGIVLSSSAGSSRDERARIPPPPPAPTSEPQSEPQPESQPEPEPQPQPEPEPEPEPQSLPQPEPQPEPEPSIREVRGTLPSLDRWSGTIRVLESVLVESSGRLEIDPGTEVVVAPGKTEILIRGLLVARGTADRPIVLRPAEANGRWAGVVFEDPASNESILDSVSIHGAEVGVYACHSSPTVLRSRFEDCDSGVDATSWDNRRGLGDRSGRPGAPRIDRCVFVKCSLGVSSINDGTPVITNSLFERNREAVSVLHASHVPPLVMNNLFRENALAIDVRCDLLNVVNNLFVENEVAIEFWVQAERTEKAMALAGNAFWRSSRADFAHHESRTLEGDSVRLEGGNNHFEDPALAPPGAGEYGLDIGIAADIPEAALQSAASRRDQLWIIRLPR